MAVGIASAQRGGRGGGGGRRGGAPGGISNSRTPGWANEGGNRVLDLSEVRNGVEMWDVDKGFQSDVFTFTAQHRLYVERGSGRGQGVVDGLLLFGFEFFVPTAAIDVAGANPTIPKTLRLTDKSLQDYPFIYMLEIGALEFTEEEVGILRHYLLNGGFLMVDDHWGVAEYENFYQQIKRVFPEREPVELGIEHPIFHCVFDLKAKPQIPSIRFALAGRSTGRTWEREDAKEPHFRAMYDNKGRIMMVICSNTDLGDGWEREGDSEWYFHEFSEKKGYPMGVNIVFYAMTH